MHLEFQYTSGHEYVSLILMCFSICVQDLIMRPVKRFVRYASNYEYASVIILLHEFQHALEYRLVMRLRFPWLYEIAKIDLIIGN